MRATTSAPGKQLSLFEVDDERQTRVERAIDEIREKFGDSSVQRGALVKPDKIEPQRRKDAKE